MLINTTTASNNPALGMLNNTKLPVSQPNTNNNPIEKNTQSPITHSQYRKDLKQKILISQRKIREKIEPSPFFYHQTKLLLQTGRVSHEANLSLIS